MKKFFIVSIFGFCSSLLIGCSAMEKNKNQEFQDKKECSNIINVNRKEILSDSDFIKEILYSKRNNSCLLHYQNNIDTYEALFDIFSKKEICYFDNTVENYTDNNEYNKSQKEFAECIEKNR